MVSLRVEEDLLDGARRYVALPRMATAMNVVGRGSARACLRWRPLLLLCEVRVNVLCVRIRDARVVFLARMANVRRGGAAICNGKLVAGPNMYSVLIEDNTAAGVGMGAAG